MSISAVYRCIWHYESGGRPHQGQGWHTDYIAAASGDPTTLAAVLNSNGKTATAPAGHSVVFDAITNVGVAALS